MRGSKNVFVARSHLKFQYVEETIRVTKLLIRSSLMHCFECPSIVLHK